MQHPTWMVVDCLCDVFPELYARRTSLRRSQEGAFQCMHGQTAALFTFRFELIRKARRIQRWTPLYNRCG